MGRTAKDVLTTLSLDFLYCRQGHTDYRPKHGMKSDCKELNITIIYQELIAFATFLNRSSLLSRHDHLIFQTKT